MSENRIQNRRRAQIVNRIVRKSINLSMLCRHLLESLHIFLKMIPPSKFMNLIQNVITHPCLMKKLQKGDQNRRHQKIKLIQTGKLANF